MFFKAFLALLFIIRLRRIPTHLSDFKISDRDFYRGIIPEQNAIYFTTQK